MNDLGKKGQQQEGRGWKEENWMVECDQVHDTSQTFLMEFVGNG